MDGGDHGVFTYSYVADSMGLVNTVTHASHTVTNTWESDRDVLQKKENQVGSVTRSSYQYHVNAIGQREGVVQNGTAFGSGNGAFSFRYNARGEVALVQRGSTPAYPGIGAVTNRWDYDFDALGNREEVVHSGSTMTPAT